MTRIRGVLTLLMFLGCAQQASAQVPGGVGNISGTITDEQRVGVPGVIVTAHGFEQSQLFKTGSDGRYSLQALIPGRYVLTAEIDGFKTIVRNGVMVRVGKTATLPLVIKVLRTEETVNVTAPLAKRQEPDASADRTAALLPSRNPLPASSYLVDRIGVD